MLDLRFIFYQTYEKKYLLSLLILTLVSQQPPLLQQNTCAFKHLAPVSEWVLDRPKTLLQTKRAWWRNLFKKTFSKISLPFRKTKKKEAIFRFEELSSNPLNSEIDSNIFWDFEPISKQTAYVFSEKNKEIQQLERKFNVLEQQFYDLSANNFIHVNVRLPGLILKNGCLSIEEH